MRTSMSTRSGSAAPRGRPPARRRPPGRRPRGPTPSRSDATPSRNSAWSSASRMRISRPCDGAAPGAADPEPRARRPGAAAGALSTGRRRSPRPARASPAARSAAATGRRPRRRRRGRGRRPRCAPQSSAPASTTPGRVARRRACGRWSAPPGRCGRPGPRRLGARRNARASRSASIATASLAASAKRCPYCLDRVDQAQPGFDRAAQPEDRLAHVDVDERAAAASSREPGPVRLDPPRARSSSMASDLVLT